MKKYLIFMLLALISIGARAVVTVQLSFESRQAGDNGWYSNNVKDAGATLQKGDFVIISYPKITDDGIHQIAICNTDGKKIYTNGAYVDENGKQQDYYNCVAGNKEFTFTIDETLLSEIKADGLQIQEYNLNQSETTINMTIQVMRMSNVDWNSYKIGDEIMGTPQYIRNWYDEGYVLKNTTNYVGKTLRVVCLDTADDSYAFLKEKGNGDPEIMTGSDKFSIAGWKYFELKVNTALNNIINGTGLRIGGNDYFIAGIYVYSGTDTNDTPWQDEESDLIDGMDVSIGANDAWASQKIDGNFFKFKGSSTTDRIANTKNNVIRLVFDGSVSASDGVQVSAKDGAGKDNNGHYASYIRQRVGTEYYNDFVDIMKGKEGSTDHYDFELSDAITIFEDYKSPVVDTENVAGVKKGMLSTLLQNGMEIGANKVKIKRVEIRKSMASKYISGYAEYNHPLSDKVWRPISLPYNLTRQQVEDAFGSNVMVCDLGASYVSKKQVIESGVAKYEYGINFSFDNVQANENGEYLNADYPYIIKLKDKGSANTPTFTYDENNGGYQGTYIFKNVKADVRDFQSYEFRTDAFTFGKTGEGVSEDEKFMDPDVEPTKDTKEHQIWDFEQQIRKDVGDAYMIFQSTAPVFNITNTGVGEVEIIDSDPQLYTPFSWTDGSYYNYYFSDGKLWPGNKFDPKYGVKSGLAYVRFPAKTYNLFEGQNQVTPANVSLAKFSCNFLADNNTTGVEEIVAQPKKQNTVGIYSLGGQLIRKGTTTDGLAKGIYIVNGKKVIVNQ